jgi:two-component system sensor kinase FixL
MFPTDRFLREMVMLTETGILVHDAKTKSIRWANPAACEMFGFTLDELLPLKAHHHSAQEVQYRREVGVAWLQEAVDRGNSRRIWKYRAKNGRTFLADARASLLAADEDPMILVEFRDISTVVEMQEELSRTTDYLSRIMVHASAGIVLLTDDFTVVDASGYVGELFEREVSELVGKNVSDLALVTDPTNGDPVDLTTLRTQDGPTELRLQVSGNESDRWLSGNLEEVAHDGISSRIMVLREITSRVEMEREYDYQQANLQYLARYNAMGDMAMTIAHELGQPLAAAQNFLTGALSRLASGQSTQVDISFGLEKAMRQLKRSSDIVNSVKRYVQRIESRGGPQDLNAILVDSLYFVRLRALERGISLESELAVEPLPLTGEHILIGQAIINYCFNAIDELCRPENQDKQLTVRSFGDEEWVCCEIADRGRGLPDSIRKERDLLTAFSGKDEGHGIGLVISENIVERHGGEVIFAKNEPRGTIVTVRLPRRSDSNPQSDHSDGISAAR